MPKIVNGGAALWNGAMETVQFALVLLIMGLYNTCHDSSYKSSTMKAEVKMKAGVTGLMILARVAMTYAQEPPPLAATNDRASFQDVSTNTSNEIIEEYLNSGEPIQVAAGQKFSIRIASNPTTGYRWQLSKPIDEKVVVLITNVYIQKRTDRLRVGVGGHEVWTFKAVGQGQTDISLRYVRSWEKNRPPANTNVFIVIVK